MSQIGVRAALSMQYHCARASARARSDLHADAATDYCGEHNALPTKLSRATQAAKDQTEPSGPLTRHSARGERSHPEMAV